MNERMEVGATGKFSDATQRSSDGDITVGRPWRDDSILAEASKLLDVVKSALNTGGEKAPTAARRLAELLASRAANGRNSVSLRGSLAPWQEHKLKQHIQNHLEEPLLVEDLARLISLSASHFSRTFKTSFGETPHAYITRLRVGQAQVLMLTTSCNLSDIALECGFADQTHLCRRFREATGASPGVWRRSNVSAPDGFRADRSLPPRRFGREDSIGLPKGMN